VPRKWEAENIGGTPTTGIRDKHIRVPRSNAPKPRWEGQRKTIWDGDAIETDKYDLQDSPSDSKLLGADEDDADDYSDDSMELLPHPPVSKEVHNTLEETVGQLILSLALARI
jgi:hypothetical protein